MRGSKLSSNYFMREISRFLTGAKWRNTDCVFVLSTGRTGTATLAELLDLSPEIEAYHEPPPNMIKERQSAFHEVASNPDKYVRIFVRARSGLIAQASLRNKMYAETSARLTFFAPVISQTCPNAKFIHLVRHPGAVVRSGMRRGWYDKNSRLNRYRIYPAHEDPFFAEWEMSSAFEKICWYWNAYNTFALRFRTTIPAERSLLLKAEDLFEGGMKTMRGLFDFLQVECPSQNYIEKILGEKMNRQVKGHFPAFGEWEESKYKRLHAIAGDTMAELGYSWKTGDK